MPPKKTRNKRTTNYNKNKNKNSIHIKIDNSRKTNYKKSNSQPSRSQGLHFVSQSIPSQQQPIILNIPSFNPIPNTAPAIPTSNPPTTTPTKDTVREARISTLKPHGVEQSKSIGSMASPFENIPPLSSFKSPLMTSGVETPPNIGSRLKLGDYVTDVTKRINADDPNERDSLLDFLEQFSYPVSSSESTEELRKIYNKEYKDLTNIGKGRPKRDRRPPDRYSP